MSSNGQNSKVGRGRPPKGGQFKGGVSGNPRGRPKGSQNRSTILRKVFGELVDVNLGGRRVRMPSGEAAVRTLMQQALKEKSIAAIRDIMQLWLQAEEDAEKAREPVYPFTEKDREVIEAIHSRLVARGEPAS